MLSAWILNQTLAPQHLLHISFQASSTPPNGFNSVISTIERIMISTLLTTLYLKAYYRDVFQPLTLITFGSTKNGETFAALPPADTLSC